MPSYHHDYIHACAMFSKTGVRKDIHVSLFLIQNIDCEHSYPNVFEQNYFHECIHSRTDS